MRFPRFLNAGWGLEPAVLAEGVIPSLQRLGSELSGIRPASA